MGEKWPKAERSLDKYHTYLLYRKPRAHFWIFGRTKKSL